MLRTSKSTVVFTQAFRLAGIDDELPAGSYVVETDAELVQELSFPVYRRIATMLYIPGNDAGSYTVSAIDPHELETALARDQSGPAVSKGA